MHLGRVDVVFGRPFDDQFHSPAIKQRSDILEEFSREGVEIDSLETPACVACQHVAKMRRISPNLPELIFETGKSLVEGLRRGCRSSLNGLDVKLHGLGKMGEIVRK